MSGNWLLTHDGEIMNVGMLSFITCMLIAAVLRTFRVNPNIFYIPKHIYQFFVHLSRAGRYIAYIDKTWRVVSGSVSAGGYLHTDNLLPNNKSHCLSDDEYKKVAVTESDEDVTHRVIALNLMELKIRHPVKEETILHGRRVRFNPFAEEPQHLEPADAILDHLDPRMRAYVERQIYPRGILAVEDGDNDNG